MRDGQMLTLSQNLTLNFTLERQTIVLGTVSVTTETDPILTSDRTGAATYPMLLIFGVGPLYVTVNRMI